MSREGPIMACKCKDSKGCRGLVESEGSLLIGRKVGNREFKNRLGERKGQFLC